MRVYLDNCCYNRPFDPQTDLRINIETQAKMRVQDLMRTGEVEYVWSAVLDYEVNRSPYQDRIDMILPWRTDAAENVLLDADLIRRGAEIQSFGIKKMDALHLACAEFAACDWFITTDRGILKKVSSLGNMRIASPIDFVMEDSL